MTRKVRPSDSELVDTHFKAPANFWDDEDLLQDIADLAAASLISPWGLLGYTLALASAASDHLVVLPGLTGASQAPLNLFVAQLGASGMGKGETRKAARALVDVDSLVSFIGVPTGEGLPAAYMDYVQPKKGEPSVLTPIAHNVMMNVDEVTVLTKSAGREGSTVDGVLCQAWSGEGLGFQTSDKAKRRPVAAMTYRLGAAIGVQPGKAGPLLQNSDQGLPQRFLWMPVCQPYDKHVSLDRRIAPVKLPAPREPGSLEEDPEEPTPMLVNQRIQNEIKQDRLARTHRSIYETYEDSHRVQLRLRVAANLSILTGHSSVTDAAWDRAAVIMAASDHYLAGAKNAVQSVKYKSSAELGEQDAHRAESRKATQAELAEQLIERGVKIVTNRADKLGGSITEREITQALRKEMRPYQEQILDRLQDDHDWTYDKRDGYGPA